MRLTIILLFLSMYASSQKLIRQSTVLDLPDSLLSKEERITAPNTIKKYLNGYKVFASFNTDSIPEGSTNLYFTNSHSLGTVLTGYTSGAGTVSSSDNILQAIQKLNGNTALNAPLASPTFTGTVTIPTPFTLGATSVTSTGTQLNYLNAASGTTGTTSTNLVYSTSPILVTPALGVATATSINKVAITAPATSATLTIVDGGSLITAGAFATTLTSTGTTNVTLPTSGTLLTTAGSGASLTGVALLGSANTFTTNGALSAPANIYTGTWITGGTATTTKPYFLIETSGASSTNWVTTGTGLGINGASGFSGNLIDLQVDAVRKFSVSSAGALTTPSLISTGSGVRPNAANTGLILGFSSATSYATANTSQIDASAATMTMTTGTNMGVYIHPTYNVASGTATYTDLRINRTETALGSGTHYFIDLQVAGASKFSIANTGKVTFLPTTTSASSFNIPTGTAPSSPADGDVWREDNTNTGLKIRVNGVTKTISLL